MLVDAVQKAYFMMHQDFILVYQMVKLCLTLERPQSSSLYCHFRDQERKEEEKCQESVKQSRKFEDATH